MQENPGGSTKLRRTSINKVTNCDGIRIFRGHVYAVIALTTFAHNSASYIVSCSVDKTVRVSDCTTGTLINILAPNSAVATMASHYCNFQVVTSHLNGLIACWDVQSGERTSLMNFGDPLHSVLVNSNVIFCGCQKGHIFGLEIDSTTSEAFVKLGFFPDSVSACNVDLGRCAVARGGHTHSVTALAAISGFLFSGDAEGKVIQWDIVHLLTVRAFHGHVDNITSIVLSDDGFMFIASKDALITIWNMVNGNQLCRLNRHFNSVAGVLVSVVSTADEPSSESLSLSHLGPSQKGVMLSFSADESVICWELLYETRE